MRTGNEIQGNSRNRETGCHSGGSDASDPGSNSPRASSDHLVLDIDDADPRPEMGGTLDFSFKRYGALLHAFNSDYIERVYVRTIGGHNAIL